MGAALEYRAVFCSNVEDPDIVKELFRLRKFIFVDQCGWDLAVLDGQEMDQFDTAEALYAALYQQNQLCGVFRAIRTTNPYLASEVFPQLAMFRPYPRRADYWEISRFGVAQGGDTRRTVRINHAVMLRFAQMVGATGLVAVADVNYERVLMSLGIRTRRYGLPQIVGSDRRGRPLQAVAGEIPLAAQQNERFAGLMRNLSTVEIVDASNVFGPSRVSA